MKYYAPLNFKDKPREMKAANEIRKGNFIYIDTVYETVTEARAHRVNEKGVKRPIGYLEEVEILPTYWYKARLVDVEY